MVVSAITALAHPAHAAECRNATIEICFRPGLLSCVDKIASALGNAKRSVLLMAYAFTSAPVAKAIAEAKKRKITVRAVLDKSNRSDKYSASDFLLNADVPVRIDGGVAISHNKVIVIDGDLVITGSYNFTRAAEERNAENVVFIRDRCTARQYEQNFETRWEVSAPYKGRQ